MRLHTIATLGVKELRSLTREPMMLLLIAYSFSLAIYAAATVMPETLQNAPIAIVDEDRSPLSESIVGRFTPPFFHPPEQITQAEMDARLDAGTDTFALDIPAGFQRDLLARRQPAIQLNVDATRMTQAFSGASYVQSIIQGEVDHFALNHQMPIQPPPVGLDLRSRFNPELNQAWFGSVMELIEQVTLLSIILSGAALIREREHGTVEHLLVMPVTPFEIMASKVWSMGLVVLLAASFSLTVVVEGILRVPIQGSIPLFLAGTALQLFATTVLGIYLGTVARTMPQFGLLLMLVLLPLMVLSGSFTPRESMPVGIRDLMLLTPNTHYVLLAQAILYRGAGLDVVWPQFVSLAVIGAVLFALSLARFRSALAVMNQ